MPLLSFKFIVPEDSSYHEARVLVDGADILEELDPSMLGIDPVDFFNQTALRTSGKMLIGRCNCGIAGCGWMDVIVNREDETVECAVTDHPEGLKYLFKKTEYDDCVEKYSADTSWEAVDRTAERLISEMDFSQAEVLGLTFKTANASLKHKDCLEITFARQQLENRVAFQVPWDGRDGDEAVKAVQMTLDEWEKAGCAPAPKWQWVE